MPTRHLHQRRALTLMRAVEPEVAFPTEVGLPESARWIDAVGVFGLPSDAWGVLRPELGGRRVFFELYSRCVSARNLATALIKAAWGLEQWLGLKVAARTGRPPVCLVLSEGHPRSGFERLPCFAPDPDQVGLHRLRCGFELIVVDTKRLRGPGTSFLRLLPSRPEDRADKLEVVYRDPDLSPATKRAIEETIMSHPQDFGPAEQALTVESVEARGEARGLARGEARGRREELIDWARRHGASEAQLAVLEAIEGLDELRDAVETLTRA